MRGTRREKLDAPRGFRTISARCSFLGYPFYFGKKLEIKKHMILRQCAALPQVMVLWRSIPCLRTLQPFTDRGSAGHPAKHPSFGSPLFEHHFHM
jgi:hypothetical protein